MKIALCGKMGSGKSHVATHIATELKYHKTSFAKRVKELAVELFGMKQKNRGLLIQFASMMREIDSFVWVNCVEREIAEHDTIVIDDLRLENEYEFLKKNGFKVVKIDIPDDERIQNLRNAYGVHYVNHIEHGDSNTENEVCNYDDTKFDVVLRTRETMMTEIYEFISNNSDENLQTSKRIEFHS